MLNPGRFLFITLLTVFASALAAGSEPVLYCADYAEAGDVVQLVVSGGDLEDIVVSLRDSSDRAVSRTEGFLWTTPTGRTASVALLGVPVSAVSGRYRVVLDARQGRAEWRLEKTVSVVRPEFRETVVEMDGTMDALYSDESERKKAEARILWSVLTSFDGRALFHMGPLIRPLDEAVRTAGFGDRRRYRSPEGAETAAIHFGEDYGAEKGTPVRASGSGRVMMASERLMTGNTVVLEHLPGVYTLYYHLDSIEVREGEKTDQGDIIGRVGETGFATGNHLHWELRVGAVPVNPLHFLSRPLLDTSMIMSNM